MDIIVSSWCLGRAIKRTWCLRLFGRLERKNKLKKKNKSIIGLCLVLLLVVCYLNWKFEVIAVHPFAGSDDYDIRVMTWNIHASKDIPLSKQRAIARLIKEQNVDFLLLNEFNKDQCELLYQELASVYRYSEEQYANKECGDIFLVK